MLAAYSIDDVAAYEEVDGSQQDLSLKLTPGQHCGREMTSIILLAHEEHEARIRHQVISSMKQRADEELAKLRGLNPFPKRLNSEPVVCDETVRALLDLVASQEDTREDDDDEVS